MLFVGGKSTCSYLWIYAALLRFGWGENISKRQTGYKANETKVLNCTGNGNSSSIPGSVEIKCGVLNSLTTIADCSRSGDSVSCDFPVLPTTQAQVSCRPGYRGEITSWATWKNKLTCNENGEWNPRPPTCIPDCGQAITRQTPLIVNGFNVSIGDFPWHASLYMKHTSRNRTWKDFICGATLIQSNLLLTAAHCVFDETIAIIVDATKLFVVMGNIYRDYDHPMHDLKVVRKGMVKTVYVPFTYYGLRGNYASDIALLELEQPFLLSEILLPACVSYSDDGSLYRYDGAYGKLAGFGRTATGVTSPILKTLTVPYVPYSECKSSKDTIDTISLITNDKFCAGYSNGTAVCEGDSGGGLVFPKNGKWFITGIVSVGVGIDLDDGEKTCDIYSYTLYTRVSAYAEWILEVISKVEKNKSSSVWTPAAKSFCLVPPEPANGEWKPDLSVCVGDLGCNFREGAKARSDSVLVYGCDSGYMVGGNSNVYCERQGNWSSLPVCVYRGDPCSLKNGEPGFCTVITNCTPVLDQLAAGNPPDKVCGYDEFQPIVCCPPTTPVTSTPTIPQTTAEPSGDGRGEIARKKCKEYAQYVFTKKYPLASSGNQQPINVSQCAIKAQKLIVGGIKAERMEFPHMAAIGFNSTSGRITWLAGGALISETFVLTAGHVVYTQFGKAAWVRVGDLNLVRTDDGATPVERRISERIKYPHYNPTSQYHNLALLRLESRVPFNGWIRPACLHTAPSTGTTKAIATGWGHSDWGEDEGSNDLLKVRLPLVDSPTCKAKFKTNVTDIKVPDGLVDDWFICAGETGKDTCQGDSGGPLVIFSKKEYCMYDVVGIKSLGKACGQGIPGAYTRVYHYISWIEGMVWGQG